MEKSQMKKSLKYKVLSKNVINLVKDYIQSYKEKRLMKKLEAEKREYNQQILNLIEKAKKDLEQSKNFFANVTDPDLVDYAAHKILANQCFYTYLLKKAKSENITSRL